MKIAILHYSSPPVVGGVESVLSHHALMMVRAGHKVTILSGRGKTFDENIPVQVLPRLNSTNAEVLKLKKLLDTGKYTTAFDNLRDKIQIDLLNNLNGYDILIAHNVASLHKNLPLTAALNQVYQLPGFPSLILWHHDLAWTTPRYRREMHPGYPWDLLRSKWEGAIHVAISQFRCTELSKLLHIDLKSIHVIPNGVDINSFYKLEQQTIQFMEELRIGQADPLFLLPARLTPRKNIELALRIMVEVLKEFPEAMLLITGPKGPHNPANTAYMQKLLQLRSDLNLQGKVQFLAEVNNEYLPDPVIADFYRLADALLFPSNEEGFGIPIIEAAFNAIPVFCADIPVLRELGGEDVSYFDPHAEPESIAKQIGNKLMKEATSRWSRRAKHSYAWDSIYENSIDPLLMEVMR
jgi:glycosyltransferase involved in cell wall biosynthesis